MNDKNSTQTARHKDGERFDALQLRRAISYIRVSTQGQAERGGYQEGLSIPAQREAIDDKAESLGAVIVKEFVERGRTGATNDRPALRELLAYVQETPGIDFVIVHKVDRLARTVAGDVDISRALSTAHVRLVSTTESIDETPSGRLVHGIMAVLAEFYSQNLSTEVLKGMRQKAQHGGTLGRAPVGYLNRRRIDEQGHEVRDVIPDPQRAILIKEAFRLYATGTWTLARLADQMASLGLHSRETVHRASRPLSAARLQEILINPYYTGLVRFEGTIYPGAQPALVDTPTWQLVQSIMASGRIGTRTRKHPHYLLASVYCAECGARLHIHHARSARNTIYPYFICSGSRSCRMPAALIQSTEQAIVASYRQIRLPAEIGTHLSKPLPAAYAAASAASRRLLNQALFERILISRSIH